MQLYVALACALLSIAATTQPNPDFSGTWVREWAPGAPEISAAPPPIVLVIDQDDRTFRQTLGNSALVFSLDGDETVNEMPSNAGIVQLKSRAKWLGRRLVLQMDGPTGRLAQVLSLSEDGNEMTVEVLGDGRKGSMTFTRR
jgi:hypothetical protein